MKLALASGDVRILRCLRKVGGKMHRAVLVSLGTCHLHIFVNSLDAFKADAQPPFAVCCSLGELHMSWGSAQLATLVFSDGVGPGRNHRRHVPHLCIPRVLDMSLAVE